MTHNHNSNGALPGMRGMQHIDITVPNLSEAVAFFVDVLGCEPYFTFGEFRFEDDWMERQLPEWNGL